MLQATEGAMSSQAEIDNYLHFSVVDRVNSPISIAVYWAYTSLYRPSSTGRIRACMGPEVGLGSNF